MPINEVSRIPVYSGANRVPGQVSASTQITTQQYNANSARQTLVSASPSYLQQLFELETLLQDNGFTTEQARKIARIGHLSSQQFTRTLLLSRTLVKEHNLFEKFVHVLKTMGARGQNVQEGIRVFLDNADRILDFNTRKIVEENSPPDHHIVTTVTPRESGSGKTQSEGRSFENYLGRDIDLKLLLAKSPQQMTSKNVFDFQNAVDFVMASMDEFPDRFHIDVFSQSALSQRGLAMNDYVKLASEIPPLRLINMLTQAEQQGQSTQTILNTLLTAQNQGENVLELFTALEQRFAPTALAQSSILDRGAIPSFFSKTMVEPRHASFTSAPLIMKEGDAVLLQFVALDSKEGLIAPEKTGSVFFPQSSEQPGNSVNLSQLPVGIYFVMMAGLDSKNKMINLWKKIIVEKRDERDPDEWQKNEKQEKHDKEAQQESSDLPPADSVTLSFTPSTEHKNSEGASRFLGQIVFPLDFAHRDASDFVVVSPETGMVVSEDEFNRGIFSHHAVTFRFLTNHVAPLDLKKRHGLLHLNESTLFVRFDADLKRFLDSPKTEIEEFQQGLEEFFNGLTEHFPAGQQTFAVAREVFAREAKAFAEGNAVGEQYEVQGFEGSNQKFMASCYAKGGYALASSGDVSGALQGMTYASLVDMSDSSHQAALGEYLENLKNMHHAKTTKDSVQNYYGTHLMHNFDSAIATSPYYTELGHSFVNAVALPLPK